MVERCWRVTRHARASAASGGHTAPLPGSSGARAASLETALARERGDASVTAPRLFYLSYRAPREEAGPEKPFDLSRGSLEGRWRAGFLDMQEALQRFDARDHGETLAVVQRAE
jgi:hypothetical protein